MKSRLVVPGIAAALFALTAQPAFSQFKPDVQVKQRQSAMVLQGKYFYGHLRPTAQGKIPYDAATVARNVGYLDLLARMPWDGFTPETKGITSRTTPAVFNEAAKWKEAQDRFTAEVSKLTEITRKGDEAAIKSQILAVDKTCGACHDNFRERQ